MKNLLILLISFIGIMSFSNAQNPQWENYVNGNAIYAIAQEGDNLWIGTGGGGLVSLEINTGIKTFYLQSNSGMPSNAVYSIVIGENGTKWIGTDKGLVKTDGTNWTVYDTSNSGLPSNRVSSICIEENDIKWIGTNEGLAEFDGINWTIYNTSNSALPDNQIHSIAIDDNGTKWIGANSYPSNGGFATFDGTNWSVYDSSNSGLTSNRVSSITIEENGTKWIGTDEGLAEFDGINWTTYNTSNSILTSNMILSVATDKNGSNWIGTLWGGVYVFNKNGIPNSIQESLLEKDKLHVYPIPVNEQLTFELDSKENISYIEILTIQGKPIKHIFVGSNQQIVYVGELPKGVYVTLIYYGNKLITKKIIKQ